MACNTNALALALLVGPATLALASPYAIDDSKGLGLRWEGVGAISGGGATTKLLMDYDKTIVSDILDFMFKPNFGLNLDILKVEIGGDTDATEGAEPSHMHYKGDEDYTRGYEWWLMKEARARNPDIKLYGLPWGWPGWLDPNSSPDKQAKNVFADPKLTANYTLAWLLGGQRVHGLNIDYIGQWNERDAPTAYAEALRAAVNSSELAGITTVLNRLPHYPGTTDTPDAHGCTQYAWNTTDGSRWVDEEGSIYDGRSARCLARCVNRNYISGCHTATFQWHLITSFYDYLPWDRCGVAVANEPWSGSYEITSPTWALAHTTQFARAGWRYAAHNSGVYMLTNGGSMVTRLSPDNEDFSIVLEKMTSANSVCARGSNPTSTATTEDVTVQLQGSFLKAAGKGLYLWKSNLSSGNGIGTNPPDDQVFQKQAAPITVSSQGTFTVTISPEELFTITTITTGNKGTANIPKSEPTFPVPFTQTFDDETISAPPKYWYDQMGAWEIQKSPTPDHEGNVMRQVVPVWPECWGYSCTGPTTYFGPSTIQNNVEVAMDFRLEDDAELSLTAAGSYSGTVTLASTGDWSMGKHTGSGLDFKVDVWHAIQWQISPDFQALVVDGKILANASNAVKSSVKSSPQSSLCDNTTFPVDLTGKQYLGLTAADASITTAEACEQACCAIGDDCNVWQFSTHPSEKPYCWWGNGRGGVSPDPNHVYISRGRNMPVAGAHLEMQLSRYVFASVDNFKITPL